MRVVIVSKALIVGAYQRKAEEIARLGVDLTVVVPPFWRDRRGQQPVERRHTEGYDLQVLPLVFNGNFHLHLYPTLARLLRELRPDLLHMDEEPYNLATWLGNRAAQQIGAIPLFFTWQNLYRRYPPPFRWMEQANYRVCRSAIAGNRDAADVLRRKGYTGDVRVIPQFGVDPSMFAPGDVRNGDHPLRIGYAGGLIPEKGIDLLLRACAGLRGDWQLTLVGSGDAEDELRILAQSLGIEDRVDLGRRLSSGEMPDFYRSIDVLALPSRSRPNWKEQFGRVLIEAMSCGTAVIGSACGEIPNVIGDAGRIFPEEDVETLRRHLQQLLDDPIERQRLGQAGRHRVLDHYTMSQIAAETVDLYRSLIPNPQSPIPNHEHRH
ncbi:MAG: glycosyltransferase family 4 protein [Caldilineaceae bacterium]|nr:glycosyltransferase family 4 protein [Caldilineaceae bacterium]